MGLVSGITKVDFQLFEELKGKKKLKNLATLLRSSKSIEEKEKRIKCKLEEIYLDKTWHEMRYLIRSFGLALDQKNLTELFHERVLDDGYWFYLDKEAILHALKYYFMSNFLSCVYESCEEKKSPKNLNKINLLQFRKPDKTHAYYKRMKLKKTKRLYNDPDFGGMLLIPPTDLDKALEIIYAKIVERTPDLQGNNFYTTYEGAPISLVWAEYVFRGGYVPFVKALYDCIDWDKLVNNKTGNVFKYSLIGITG